MKTLDHLLKSLVIFLDGRSPTSTDDSRWPDALALLLTLASWAAVGALFAHYF